MAKRRASDRPTPLPRRAPLVAVGTAALAAGLLGCGPKKTQSKPPQAISDDQYNVAPQDEPPPQVDEQPPPMVPPDEDAAPPTVPTAPKAPQPPPPMVPGKQPQPAPKGMMQFPLNPPPMVEPFDGLAPPRRKR